MASFCIHCKSEIDPKYKACPFCGEPITDFLRRYLGAPIDGKYQILAPLGAGGMGEVYKVLHIHLNTIRVIKLMRANIAGDDGANERFLREARLATKINHPSVATLFDFSTLEDGAHYMVWEYIEGTNLHQLIEQRGPLSPRYAARLAVEALSGLDAIHRAGIVHRDVSPENLMITRDSEGVERVKVIDLGIAKSSASEDNKTKTGMFVGKWKYCSPEHLGMLPAGERIDGRADLYSFGIVLYEMLTGVPPFQADTPHAYLMMHSQQRPKKLRDSNPHVVAGNALEALVFRALEKDRSKRFASAREFAQEIEKIADSLSNEAGAPPPLPASAEVTDEATRVTPQAANDVATVATRELEATLVTSSGAEAGRAEEPADDVLPDSPPTMAVESPVRRRAPMFAAAAVAGVLAAGAWIAMRRPEPVAAKPADVAPVVTMSVHAAPTAAPPSTPGRVGINAFPWANVTSVRNLDDGRNVDIGAPVVTPAPLELPPGRYEVTLSNPRYPQQITRTVVIRPGAEEMLTVQFSDPSSAPLPDFGGPR